MHCCTQCIHCGPHPERFSEFIAEVLEESAYSYAPMKEMYPLFKTWYRVHYEGKMPLKRQLFAFLLTTKHRMKRGRGWEGLRIPDGDKLST